MSWSLATTPGRALARSATSSPLWTTTTTASVPSLPLDIVSQQTARIPPPIAVASSGPATGQIGLVFTSRQIGFLAAVPEPQASGYASGATSELERTSDGGVSWATVWRGRDIVLHWAGRIGGSVAAAGIGPRGPLLVESADNGAIWSQVPVVLTLPSVSPQAAQNGGAEWYWATSTLYFLNRQVGFAFPDAMYGQDAAWPAVLFRTSDGGRRWSAIALPGGSPSGGLVFVDGTHGFVTGLSALTASGSLRPGCTSRIWETADAGTSWRAVPGTCAGYLLTSLSFPTPERGYAGGGNYAKSSQVPQLAVLATADGGRRWSQVFATPKHPAGPGGEHALEDLSPGEHRARVRNGKGGRERIVPISERFFASVTA